MEHSAQQIRTLLAQAYVHDPLMQWLFKGVDEAEHAVAAWLNVFVERYLRSGCVRLAESDGCPAGVAMWRPPGVWPAATSDLPTAGGLLAGFVGSARAQVLGRELHQIAGMAPNEAHLYLQFLAVDTRSRGAGIGTQLLQTVLAQARTCMVPVHLETTNPLAVPFYESHGFTITAEQDLGSDGPTAWAMLHL